MLYYTNANWQLQYQLLKPILQIMQIWGARKTRGAHIYIYVGVSKNRGTPNWMVYNGRTLLTWMIWGGKPLFSEIPHIFLWQVATIFIVRDGSTILAFTSEWGS